MSTFDSQDEAESLDDDKLAGDYPPDELLGADSYGTTAAEERIDEPLEERVAREEPEAGVEASRPADDLGDPERQLDVDDIASGDTTLRDVAQEREAPVPAEEAALHVVDDAY